MRKGFTALLSALVLVAAFAGGAGAHPDDGGDDHHGQHDSPAGHLPPSSANVELLGRVDLTSVTSGIADVAAWGNYAYLNTFSPECAGRPGAQGTGVHVVDFSDPTAPTKVAFLPAEPNSYPGEGVHIVSFQGRQFLVHNNETCDSSQPVVSGFALWDVTVPLSPMKIGQYGDTTPPMANQTFHTTHSVQAFVWQDRLYAVAQDNQDFKDVDIFDLTPAVSGTGPATLIAERGLEDWPGAQGSYANGDSVFHHDVQQKVIDGHNYLAVSYWDAGQVILNIDDPSNPVFVGDTDFSSPDPEMPAFQIPEGNSHQSYWDQDGDYLLASDEDFSPTRTLCRIASGPDAGDTGCGEFSWAVPLSTSYPSGFTGSTVFGGSGCIEDTNGNGTSDRAEVPSAASTGAEMIVFGRGTCFFSTKVESGQLAGYDMVGIGQSHGGTRNGLLPDGFTCGSQGHSFTVTASAVCIGHRAMHQLFADAPAYTGPDLGAGGDLPAIGTPGESFSAQGGVFDGWGYVHLYDARTLAEIDTYAVAESKDPAFASGFGNLTVHEVKTDPRPNKDLAYMSYYDAGLRIARFGPDGITEVGHYIAEGGNDFWGVYPVASPKVAGQGRAGDHVRPLILMSDRDSGLWILRYTGGE